MPTNLWPNFDIGRAPRSPKTVIEEAGAGLDEKTNGTVRFWALGTSMKDNNFQSSFSLYSPALRYHYPFLRAKFALEPVYPVTISPDKMTEIVANDEKELIAALTKIFNAPSTVETIQRLMSLGQE